MAAEPGLSHRFPMLKRAAEHLATQGRFDESLKIVEEILSLGPDDAGPSKVKGRFAAELVRRAVQAQKIEAATRILEMLDARIPAKHLGDPEREHVAKARDALLSL